MAPGKPGADLGDFRTPRNESVRDSEIRSRYPNDDWPMTTDNDDDDDDDDDTDDATTTMTIITMTTATTKSTTMTTTIVTIITTSTATTTNDRDDNNDDNGNDHDDADDDGHKQISGNHERHRSRSHKKKTHLRVQRPN